MWSESDYQYRMLLGTWRVANTMPADEKLFRALERKYLTGPIGGPMDAHKRVGFEDQLAGIDKYKGPHQQRGYRGYKK